MNKIDIEWHGREIIAKIDGMCRQIVRKTARAIVKDAKSRCPESPDGDSGLKNSIKHRTFEHGGGIGAYISAGERNREHISGFVELGTPGTEYTGKRRGQKRTPQKAQPFLRPAIKKNKAKFLKAFKSRI
jgi:HK97 gp10 family phage protein